MVISLSFGCLIDEALLCMHRSSNAGFFDYTTKPRDITFTLAIGLTLIGALCLVQPDIVFIRKVI